MVIVGLPYSEPGLSNMEEITGGTPYGATTLAAADGSRKPSDNELTLARAQGRHVAEIATKLAGCRRLSWRRRPRRDGECRRRTDPGRAHPPRLAASTDRYGDTLDPERKGGG